MLLPPSPALSLLHISAIYGAASYQPSTVKRHSRATCTYAGRLVTQNRQDATVIPKHFGHSILLYYSTHYKMSQINLIYMAILYYMLDPLFWLFYFDYLYYIFFNYDVTFLITSGKFNKDFVKLEWLNGSFNNNDYENSDVDKKLSTALPSLGVDTFVNQSEICMHHDRNRGNFSCLNFHITFYR